MKNNKKLISFLTLTMSLFLTCNLFVVAENIDDMGNNGGISPRAAFMETEPNDSISTANDISNYAYPSAVNGFISSSGDVDFYKFRTTSSQSGKIRLSLSVPLDCDYDIIIYKGTSSNVCGKAQAVGNENIIFSVSPNTNYYIKVYSANSQYAATTPYTFTLMYFSASENVYGSLGWAYPLPSEYTSISTYQDSNNENGNLRHSGIDLPAPEGTSIYNTASGIVYDSGYWQTGGYYVIVMTDYYEPNSVNSRGQIYVRYLHMVNKANVNKNQTVARNTILGKVGSTGISTGNHLHIDINNIEAIDGSIIRSNPSNCINPILFYPRKNFVSSAVEGFSADDIMIESGNWHYSSVSKVISDQVNQEEYGHFIEMYSKTGNFNIVNFVKYFNYPKDLFESIVNEYDLEWYNTDVIYSDNEALIADYYGLEY